MSHPVSLKVELIPVWHQDPPEILIGIDSGDPVILNSAKTFEYEFVGDGKQ